ncbi:amidohydrolase [Xanthovirga aplysinae]|uniref:amidohydrolase n=1 Tax=Xanthovirga aplysinae TaxID=2529853 RepID=UPI0012BBEC70|nr:amidohydrolase [Xanthovirga aplysinae]MTI30657.1 amidohydrolase [Xanthovirga aplysinae]
MRNLFYFFVPIFFLFLSCSSVKEDDLIIYNGQIYTMDTQNPIAEAVVVNDGKISFVGKIEEVKNRLKGAKQLLDLKGKAMTPGFIESHGHLMGMGEKALSLDLTQCETFEEMVEKVKEAVAKTNKGEWILGRGWHQSKWKSMPDNLIDGFPTEKELSAVSPDNPVYLGHANGHVAMVNSKALEITGVNPESKMENFGVIVKYPDGKPTGILHDDAMLLVSEKIPVTKNRRQKAFELAIQECLKNGVTTFRDAGTEAVDIDLFKENLEKGKVKVRLWSMLAGWDNQLLDHWFNQEPEIGLGNGFLTIRAIKLSADGALGSRSAWLLEDYSDFEGHRGHNTIAMDSVYSIAKKALNKGYQLCVHAIGDRANQEVLDQFEKAFKENPDDSKTARFRIEHAQHLALEDIPRFSDLGVIASMQSIHLSSDRPWAIDRLGEQRIKEGAYVWQKLLQSGVKIVNGTDAPVEPLDPLANFYAAVSRKTLKGSPEGGYEADQKMSREEALRSYTIDAAYGGIEEDLKGSIEVGKLADFTVFSNDIMMVEEREILNTQVLYTIVDGKVAFERKLDVNKN